MASLDDILTTQKNGVVGINNVADVWLTLSGKQVSSEIIEKTAVKTSSGIVAKVSVISSGSGTGTIYNANSIGTAIVGTRIYVIPNAVGIYDVNLPSNTGIVVEPSAEMIVVISYS